MSPDVFIFIFDNFTQDVNQNFIGDECEKGEDFDRDGFLGHHHPHDCHICHPDCHHHNHDDNPDFSR